MRTFLMFFLIICKVNAVAQGYKSVQAYNNKITFDVPIHWKYQDNYKPFFEYDIKFNARYSDSSTGAVSINIYKVRVFDSIVNKFIEKRKANIKKYLLPSMTVQSTRIFQIKGITVGCFTYHYVSKINQPSFGAELFFMLSTNEGAHVEIFGEYEALHKSEEIVDRIIKSLDVRID